MQITCLCTLTDGQRAEILALDKDCIAPEKLNERVHLSDELNYDRSIPAYYLGYDENGRLTAFLTLLMLSSAEAEVSAFTHPQSRRRGWFTALLGEAKRVCATHGIPSLLFAVEDGAKAGHAVLSTMANIRHDHTECRMLLSGVPEASIPRKLATVPVTAANAAVYEETLAAAFTLTENADSFVQSVLHNPARSAYLAMLDGDAIGVCHMNTGEGSAFLYGLGMRADMRNKGYGKAFTRDVVRIAVKTGLPVMLDVDDDNVVALSLYRGVGFSEVFRIEYYTLPLLPAAK